MEEIRTVSSIEELREALKGCKNIDEVTDVLLCNGYVKQTQNFSSGSSNFGNGTKMWSVDFCSDPKKMSDYDSYEEYDRAVWQLRCDYTILIECNNLNAFTSEDIFYYVKNQPESIVRFELVETHKFPTDKMTVLLDLRDAL